MAKLYELHHEHDFDVIVLDTPPSRNALDFLERARPAARASSKGRALRVFLAPERAHRAGVRARRRAIVFAIFARVTGVDMLERPVALLPLAGGPHRRLRRADARASSELLRAPRRRRS